MKMKNESLNGHVSGWKTGKQVNNMELILFAIATIGLTNILVSGKIFDDKHLGTRKWAKRQLGSYSDLLDCHECTGFWSGLLMGFLLFSFWNPCVLIPCAFAGAALSSFYNDLNYLILSKTDFVVGDSNEPENQQ
jgi:hypothetical protein